MRMGQYHRVEVFRVEAEACPIALFLCAPPLIHAAVEQHSYPVMGFEQIARAGDLLNCTEKTEQSHEEFLLYG